jgi:hypothetical protein
MQVSDVRDAARTRRFVMCDASETLSTFMADGTPDRARFYATVGQLILATQAASAGNDQLTVFGEMVAVLWEEGNHTGALALEELWNQVLTGGGFHLHCAYPRYGFMKHPDHLHMIEICKAHTHIV